MTAVLPWSKLAPTRWFSGCGGFWPSAAAWRWIRNRLSATCSGVRTQGARVNTVATVALLLQLAFWPWVSRTLGCAPAGLTLD